MSSLQPPAPAESHPAASRRRSTLRRRTASALAAVAVVIAAAMVTVIIALVTLTRRGNEVVKRWGPAYNRSLGVLSALVSQESAIRGYALSSDRGFLRSYHNHLTAENAEMAALRSLVGPTGSVSAETSRLSATAARWHADVVRPYLAAVATRASDPAKVVSPEATAAFNSVRDASRRLSADLADLRDTAAQRRAVALDFVWTAIGVGGAVVVLAFPAVLLGLHRGVLAPVERLAAQTRAVADGDVNRTIEPFGPFEVYSLGQDVDRMRSRIGTELERVEQARVVAIARGEELARSNADLEQFAYVASHDLSEPLRKVANFCQLLERQYAAQLDDKAKQYIAFAVDGAKRMQILIGDLLAFSRVGRTTEHFEAVALDAALDRALTNLDDRITAADAKIERDPLPVVQGDSSLLTALFQNLVGNALKYRDESRTPHVRITAEQAAVDDTLDSPLATRQQTVWKISIADNGIGIDPQYAERIFVIFQRLHLRDQYGGTGIGLALCRRIVEFHGGRIWLETDDASDQRGGATFAFTIPERREATEPVDV